MGNCSCAHSWGVSGKEWVTYILIWTTLAFIFYVEKASRFVPSLKGFQKGLFSYLNLSISNERKLFFPFSSFIASTSFYFLSSFAHQRRLFGDFETQTTVGRRGFMNGRMRGSFMCCMPSQMHNFGMITNEIKSFNPENLIQFYCHTLNAGFFCCL